MFKIFELGFWSTGYVLFYQQAKKTDKGLGLNRPNLTIQLMSKHIFELNSMMGSTLLLIYVSNCDQNILKWVDGWNIC